MKQNGNYTFIGLLFCLTIALFSCEETSIPLTSDELLLSKRYNEVCFMMTHNAMNNTEKGFTIPNQTHSITNQLKNGVRGLMIDTYDGNNGVALTYHGTPIVGQQKLVDVLQEIKDFLSENPKAVISIIFENNGSNVQLQTAIDSIGLDKFTFTYNGTWPTLQTMTDSNQRLVLFAESDKLPNIPYLMHAWSTVFDTKYSYKELSEFDCAVNRGGSGTRELYLINHWLGNVLGLPDKSLAPKANARGVVGKRVQECSAANSHFVNFLGVDFYEIGDAKAVVDSINGL
ncbi:MAG: phosphatidylinositol-specific phospholipase C domain-containing protein [Sphingobacteriales bacterium]|nr:phosphatidylinositol-specific phospholipase C domain-containing protein [Sphingobacteriales bacterium]